MQVSSPLEQTLLQQSVPSKQLAPEVPQELEHWKTFVSQAPVQQSLSMLHEPP